MSGNSQQGMGSYQPQQNTGYGGTYYPTGNTSGYNPRMPQMQNSMQGMSSMGYPMAYGGNPYQQQQRPMQGQYSMPPAFMQLMQQMQMQGPRMGPSMMPAPQAPTGQYNNWGADANPGMYAPVTPGPGQPGANDAAMKALYPTWGTDRPTVLPTLPTAPYEGTPFVLDPITGH